MSLVPVVVRMQVAGAAVTRRGAKGIVKGPGAHRLPEVLLRLGPHGGWFMALTWNFGSAVTIAWNELRRLIASSNGDVVIARRLVGNALRALEEARAGIEDEVDTRVIHGDELRWRSPRKR